MTFVYTKHAQVRIRQRRLRQTDIKETVIDPDTIFPSFKGRRLARRAFGEKTLEVVFKRERNQVIIVTAYWL